MTAEQYKSLAEQFNSADFGEYTADTFISANKYRKPTVYPEKGAHPRILFTKNTVERLRENIKAEESAEAYKKYLALSESDWDGKFKPLTGDMRENYDENKVSVIDAKALRYVLTGDKSYGYEAITAAKNAMLTINVPHTVGDWCRRYGYLMYVISCAYDWCYDLLTEEDKDQLVRGCVNLLGMHFETCCYVSPTNKVPLEQGTAYGHGAEDQVLVDYLAFAIACFDEAPEIYELVGGRVLNDYPETQNFLLEGGSHWEGSMYGSVRSAATLMSNILINKMTDGKFTPFSPKLEDAVVTLTTYIRPDGHVFRIGDINENNTAYQFIWMAGDCFFAGTFYRNAYLKSMAYKYLNKFTKFLSAVACLSVVQFLALNDPSIPYTYDGELPLTRTTTYPSTNIFARSKNNEENAFAIYMTMPETYSSSHAHMECGSFQIFYKGALASDSGAYSSWGGPHHMGYNMQTIASNSILIYNPALKDYVHPWRKNMIYSGGQSIENGADLPTTYDKLMKHPALGQCTSLGLANVEKDGEYLYSYMAGDMTKAYDAITADEVSRYMLGFATNNESCPFAFMTFDRITSKDPSFKKTALIHIQQEPEMKDGCVVVTNTRRNNSGRMIVQSVSEKTEYTVIGGEGKEFWVNDHNIPHGKTIEPNSLEEYGWGRIEISPKAPEKTNRLLTVMYVTDAANDSSPVKAAEIECSENLVGAEIFEKAVLFSKNEKLLTKEASFTLESAKECFVTGVSAGKWTVICDDTVIDTVVVAEKVNMFTFAANKKGTYKLMPAN